MHVVMHKRVHFYNEQEVRIVWASTQPWLLYRSTTIAIINDHLFLDHCLWSKDPPHCAVLIASKLMAVPIWRCAFVLLNWFWPSLCLSDEDIPVRWHLFILSRPDIKVYVLALLFVQAPCSNQHPHLRVGVACVLCYWSYIASTCRSVSVCTTHLFHLNLEE